MPTIAFADTAFARLSKTVARSLGAPALPIAVVPTPIEGRTVEENRTSAESVIDDVIYALTNPPQGSSEGEKGTDEIITIEGNNYAEAVEKMNELFMDKKWGDGLPLIPPTEEAVDRMLKGTSHSPDEVVGVLEQRKGIATVKIVAINAVMAGCKPEYLPVVLAAVEAVTNPEYNLYGVQATTAPAVPLLAINGPIRKELDINCSSGCMGPGYPANATIGRAFNLVMTAVGGRSTTTMTSVGDPGRFTWCFGENEEELPADWLPLHMDKGYKPEESTVTVMNVHWKGPIHGFFAPTTDDEAIEHVSEIIKYELPNWSGEKLLVLLPEIAAQLSRKAATKKELREILFANARLPWKELKESQSVKIGSFPPDEIEGLNDDTMLSPILPEPDYMNIIVTGGAGRHSYLVIPWIKTRTITALIDKWR
ncbi:hypothetical protein ACFLYL_05125 [Chloroflexota bacterium]